MTAFGSSFTHTAGSCAGSAAACASARIHLVMDTVMILAVSIFVCLLDLRIWS